MTKMIVLLHEECSGETEAGKGHGNARGVGIDLLTVVRESHWGISLGGPRAGGTGDLQGWGRRAHLNDCPESLAWRGPVPSQQPF